ncbi:CD81 protein-like [Diadema setosum]|uniref:CD81 protein-like n=1 Tax=Diadema setosum TaxID=31175 RepID=UPI003B3B281A
MAVRGGCMLIVKCLLFFFNFVLWCAGGTILGFAIWVRFDENSLKQLPDDSGISIYGGTYVLMAAGGAIMVVGFFGCCGAIRESICQLSTYFVIVFAIFCAEIGVGIWVYLEKEEIGNEVGDYFVSMVEEKYVGDVSIQLMVDITQRRFKCCGANGPNDWTDSGQMIPDSCSSNCTECEDVGEYESYEVGCKPKIIGLLQQNLYIVGVAVTTVALVEVLAMILTVLLCRAIRRDIDDDDEKPYNA